MERNFASVRFEYLNENAFFFRGGEGGGLCGVLNISLYAEVPYLAGDWEEESNY